MIINSKIYNIPSPNSVPQITIGIKLIVISKELTPPEHDLLQKMVSATGLTKSEFMHIIPNNQAITLNSYANHPNPLKIISFDISSNQLGLQVTTPPYRIFKLQNLDIVIVDDLKSIGEEVKLKKFIWNALKTWFINDK